MTYLVRLDQFEGPLDLLLYLIQREEMDISDIPIARITEQYLQHIENMDSLDLNAAGDFLVMAATLLRIKSRMLLPVERPGEEGDEDPRAELVQRLLEYKKFKEAAKRLEEHESERLRAFTRPLDASLVDEARKHGDEETFEINLPQLMKALQSVLGRFEAVVSHEVQLEPVSLEDRSALLRERLRARGRLPFSDLFDDAHTRMEVIVTFMALLELIKGGFVRAHQADSHSELWMFHNEDQGALHAQPPDATANGASAGMGKGEA